MRNFRKIVLTGVAALAVAGAAFAAGRDAHRVQVNLPDGSVANIEYEGDKAPPVSIVPVSHIVPAGFHDPAGPAPFGYLDQIAADMDRQADTMRRELESLGSTSATIDGTLNLASLGKLPPGTVSYRFVSTEAGNHSCDRTIEITSFGSGRQPRVISNSTGDCKAIDGTPAPARLDLPHSSSAPKVTGSASPAAADVGKPATIA